jgi:hypothetical protein
MRTFCGAVAVIIIAAAISGAAQQLADCAQIKSPGCNSFNEMLTSRDPDIVETIKQPNYITYVCFQPNDDAFTMLTFSLPTNKWKRTQSVGRKRARESPIVQLAIQESKDTTHLSVLPIDTDFIMTALSYCLLGCVANPLVRLAKAIIKSWLVVGQTEAW